VENTFDINAFSVERHKSPASYKQCQALSYKFAKDQKTGKINWRFQKQVLGCLFGLASEKRLTFKKANDLFKSKTLPKPYMDKIALYLKENS
jgi:hypothetical protein